jgi:ADP-ribose pyrophosphatase YjhB (NUDIX family)
MGFEDWFRLSVHAVITDEHGRVLLMQATYGDRAWGLPGGALDPGETIHDALRRECLEELGLDVEPLYLSGVYHHAQVHSHAFIFRARLPPGQQPTLSGEHSAWKRSRPSPGSSRGGSATRSMRPSRAGGNRIFGRFDACPLPRPEWRGRFLD